MVRVKKNEPNLGPERAETRRLSAVYGCMTKSLSSLGWTLSTRLAVWWDGTFLASETLQEEVVFMLCPFSRRGPPTAADKERGPDTKQAAADELQANRRQNPPAGRSFHFISVRDLETSYQHVFTVCAVRDTKDVVAMATSSGGPKH